MITRTHEEIKLGIYFNYNIISSKQGIDGRIREKTLLWTPISESCILSVSLCLPYGCLGIY